MQNFGYSMLWYWSAYIIVTAVGVGHTIYNATVKHMGVMGKERVPMNQIECYAKTMPWHPLYNIIIFPIFAGLYLNGLGTYTIRDALAAGLVWVGITILFDLVGWVIIPHPYQCTFRDFYVDYQPWISIVYLVIFVSPLVAYWVLGFIGSVA